MNERSTQPRGVPERRIRGLDAGRRLLQRFVADEEGVEILDWALLTIVFALAASAGLLALQSAIDQALAPVERPGPSAP